MKASLFSPILVLLIITLFAKASMLFGRIQEQTTYSMDTSASSVLVESAYADSSSHGSSKKSLQSPIASLEKNKEYPSSAPSTDNSVINNMTRSEINLLKELSKRRNKLEKE